MKLQFLGAVRTVTGSMHLLSVNGTSVLMDCGLYQGKRAESFARNRNVSINGKWPDVLVLSHAHIDHCGNIPSLVRKGFDGYIFCTPATRDLCAIMLRDSAHIQASDTAYVNKKRRKLGQPPVEPLYTQEDVEQSMSQFISIGYERPFPIAPGVTLTYYDAGHILGSAMVCLDVEEKGRQRRLLFSGDVGRVGASLLRDPSIPQNVNILLTESTYGNRSHGHSDDRVAKLRDIVNETCRHGGKVIIPSFALGRTQDIVYSLHQLLDNDQIPEVPVFVDSPLAVNATEVFLLHADCYDQETREFLVKSHSRNPFSFGNVHYIREVEQSKKLNTMEGPAIIISASGMCEAGRIQHHLKNHIENEANTVVIVGWQAPYTLGRRLVEKKERIKIFGERYVRRADVQVISGFSAHADRGELLDWFKGLQNPGLEHVFVIHGEEKASLALAEALRERGGANVVAPEPKDEVEV